MSILSSSLGAHCSSLCGLGRQPEVCLYPAVDGYLAEKGPQDTAGTVSASWLGIWLCNRLLFVWVEDTGDVLRCDGSLECLGGARDGP